MNCFYIYIHKIYSKIALLIVNINIKQIYIIYLYNILNIFINWSNLAYKYIFLLLLNIAI